MERNGILDLIRRLEQIDLQLGGDGPHPLASSVSRALQEL